MVITTEEGAMMSPGGGRQSRKFRHLCPLSSWIYGPEAGVGKLFCQGTDSIYLRLSWSYIVPTATTQLGQCSMKSAIDNMQTNGHGCILTIF